MELWDILFHELPFCSFMHSLPENEKNIPMESVFRHNKKKLPSALPASLFNVLIMTYFNLFQKSSICRIEQLARLFFPLKYHKPITDINQILISIRSIQSNKR